MGPIIGRRHREIEQELGHLISHSVDLAAEINRLLGFRAAEPVGARGVLLGETGVRELVRLVDSMESDVIAPHRPQPSGHRGANVHAIG